MPNNDQIVQDANPFISRILDWRVLVVLALTGSLSGVGGFTLKPTVEQKKVEITVSQQEFTKLNDRVSSIELQLAAANITKLSGKMDEIILKLGDIEKHVAVHEAVSKLTPKN